MPMMKPSCPTLALLLFGLIACAAPAQGGSPARRVVSLAPSLTELIFDLGLEAHLVGRSSACDYPPEALALPVAGPFGKPNTEQLQYLRADLVLATDLERPGLLQALRRAGTETLVLPCESWDQLMVAAVTIAEALGDPEAGRTWSGEMNGRRQALERRVNAFYESRERPRVYLEIWGRPPTTAGAGTILNETVTMAGGRNIAGGLRTGYRPISSEWVIREDPDVIVFAYMLPGHEPAEALRTRKGWSSLRAVRKGAMCDGIPPDWLLRPGPRLIRGAEALAQCLMDMSEEREHAGGDGNRQTVDPGE